MDLLRITLEYFKTAESDDPMRQGRQHQLSKEYAVLLQAMESKITGQSPSLSTLCECVQRELIADYDAQRVKNHEDSQAVFLRNDEFKKDGPYRLTAYLMRTGLGGRPHSWVIIRSGEQWFKILDLTVTEVGLAFPLRTDNV